MMGQHPDSRIIDLSDPLSNELNSDWILYYLPVLGLTATKKKAGTGVIVTNVAAIRPVP